MGMYIFSKAIHQDEVVASFGSKDDALFEKIKQTDTYNCYNEQPFADSILLEEALHHIIYGEPYVKTSAHVYGYAYISMCEVFGKELPYTNEFKLGYETELVTNYLESDFGKEEIILEEYLFEGDIKGDLPERPEFPVIGIVTTDKLQAIYDMLPEINLSEEALEELYDEDDDKACAYEIIIGVRQNIKTCMEQGLDLVSFCH